MVAYYLFAKLEHFNYGVEVTDGAIYGGLWRPAMVCIFPCLLLCAYCVDIALI